MNGGGSGRGSEQHLRRARPGSLHFTWGSSSANREAVANWSPGCHGLTCADMGNQLSNPRYSQPDSLAELPMPVVFKDNLGEDERHRLVLSQAAPCVTGCALQVGAGFSRPPSAYTTRAAWSRSRCAAAELNEVCVCGGGGSPRPRGAGQRAHCP